VNGEVVPFGGAEFAALRRLANRRALSASECAALPRSVIALLHQWYRYGFLHAAA
jgi:hypothetical protein